jgi:hypothetical protein
MAIMNYSLNITFNAHRCPISSFRAVDEKLNTNTLLLKSNEMILEKNTQSRAKHFLKSIIEESSTF